MLDSRIQSKVTSLVRGLETLILREHSKGEGYLAGRRADCGKVRKPKGTGKALLLGSLLSAIRRGTEFIFGCSQGQD